MRTPNENLYDFNLNAAQPGPVEPPPFARLRPSGQIEILKPLVSYKDLMSGGAAIGGTRLHSATSGLSWFHRSLAVGGLAITALLLGSFFVATSGPPADPSDGEIAAVNPDEVARDAQTADILTSAEELGFPTSLPTVDSAIDGFVAIRKVTRSSHTRPDVLRSVYRPRRVMRRPQVIVSEFVPTALIIYAENGEIKTRIEPQLTAGYKRPLPLSN